MIHIPFESFLVIFTQLFNSNKVAKSHKVLDGFFHGFYGHDNTLLNIPLTLRNIV